MTLSIIFLILAIGLLPLSRGVEYEELDLTRGQLTTGEAVSRLTVMKREIGKDNADGRGLVYSGPVKVITDPKDHSKYYMDKGSAFDYTEQEPQAPQQQKHRVKQHQRMITTGKFQPETPQN